MKKVLGIDLGTTYARVAVFKDRHAVILNNSEGKSKIPSVVTFNSDGTRLVGQAAKRKADINTQNTILDIERLLGRPYQQVQKELQYISYDVVERNGFPCVYVNGQYYMPQEIIAMIIRELKKTAEDYLGQECTDAVITVPGYFGINERQAIREAARIAGISCRRIIAGSTAACIAYCLGRETDQKIAVLDFGGGSCDITIAENGSGVIETLVTVGDKNLGGNAFDQVVVNWLADEFQREEGIDLRNDKVALARLKLAAENAKITLSLSTSAEIRLPYIARVNNIYKNIVTTLTRSKFEQLIEPLLHSCVELYNRALHDAFLTKADIDVIMLVGGLSKMPTIQQFVKKHIDQKTITPFYPFEAAALGAAIQGAIVDKDTETGDFILLDSIPYNIGIETSGGVMTKIIQANSTIPLKVSEIFSTSSDNQTEVAIHLLQGDSPMAANNTTIARFNLVGIQPAKKGVPEIIVTFDIDANSVLKVSAKDKHTGKEQAVKVYSPNALPEKEIERMRDELLAYEQGVQKKSAADDTQQGPVLTLDSQAQQDYLSNRSTSAQVGLRDIFISYSRNDKTLVMPLVERINRELNTCCWIDLTGIESGSKFEPKIMEAIKNTKVVLFMLSDCSLRSEWTQREVYYAEQLKKKIIPVLVDGEELRDWFLFHFGNVDCINIQSEEQIRKLIKDIKKFCMQP